MRVYLQMEYFNAILKIIDYRIHRNYYLLNGEKAIPGQVNLVWWKRRANLGDYLATVIFQWMLERKQILSLHTKETTNLMTVGSLIGMGNFDATIWGTGIHCFETAKAVMMHSKYVHYDIRAVRGPITKEILRTAGYSVKDCFEGDPAVLMPFIYAQEKPVKKYNCSIVHHLSSKKDDIDKDLHTISISTTDYQQFISELQASQRVISSSLHGIILAESYGVPAIFLNSGMDNELLKYYDWYFSTGRMNVKIAHSIEEAMQMVPMPLPNISSMQRNLLSSFPYDLFYTKE